jgi:hypothetical protein
MADQFRRSDPQAIQDVRDSQDELWKTDAQDASFYEDVLALFDEQNAARTARENSTASLEVERLTREIFEEFWGQFPGVSDHASVASGSSDPSPISDEDEAARTLLALRYSGPTQNYIQDTESSNGVTLRPFDEQVIPALRLGSALEKTGRLRSTTQKNLEKAAAEIQQPEGHSSTPRRMRNAGADNAPARPERSTTSRKAAPAQNVEEMTDEVTLPEGGDERQRPKKSHTPDSREIVSRPDFIIRSPAQDLSERTQPKLRFPMRPSLISRGKKLDDRSATRSQDPRRLRSKVKIPPASTTSVGTRALRSSTKPPTDVMNLSSTSKDEIKSSDRSRGFDRFVDFSPPSTSVTNLDTLDVPVSESPTKRTLGPRRSKRKATIVVPEVMASPTPKKLKLAEQSGTDSPTPIREKGRQIPHEDDENDEDVNVSIKNSPSKPKAKPTARPRKLVNAPAELPLKAQNNTPGIPDDALAIDEFFKVNTPSTLGVQLPVDRARTQWEWVPYVTRKAGNAQFDWADPQHLKDVNRWRQQRIPRRFAEHGVVDDGRKRRRD